uniref:Uncharacterized protein n=1 Tax=Anguilla anguilla TaxID=7936 RepID=A0A0E9VTU7_ANGAN
MKREKCRLFSRQARLLLQFPLQSGETV